MPRAFRAIRRANLARVLRFYADKAQRHGLPDDRHRNLGCPNRPDGGAQWKLSAHRLLQGEDRGWVFCPEYRGRSPMKISPSEWQRRWTCFYLVPVRCPTWTGASIATDWTESHPGGDGEASRAIPESLGEPHRCMTMRRNLLILPSRMERGQRLPPVQDRTTISSAESPVDVSPVRITVLVCRSRQSCLAKIATRPLTPTGPSQ